MNISTEAELYAIVAKELERKEINQGIYLMALTEAMQDEQIAKSLYVKYRIAHLLEQFNATQETINSIVKRVASISNGCTKVISGEIGACISAATKCRDAGNYAGAFFWSHYSGKGKLKAEIKSHMKQKYISEIEELIKAVDSIGGLQKLLSYM